jgi:alkanesulfonate monooxygenase SsuD/methylene tetrahydromethanopterin reductase-like flavin-dependent oxidoreductase (luciferase family)
MHYGLHIPNFGPYGDAHVLAELAHEAEEAGWNGFFLWDQVAKTTLTPGIDPMVDPWIALAAIALRTNSIRLGTLITPLPRRRPWNVARETVSLDHLSGGRMVFGAGLGGGYYDFAALGEASDLKTLAGMLDEGLQIVNGLWSGEPFHFEGTYYRIREAQFLPRPVQMPRIPIWVAATWPLKSPFRRAVRWDGVFPQGRDLPLTGMLSLQEVEALLRFLKEQPGFAPSMEIVHGGITTGEDASRDADLAASYARVGVTWWIEKIVPERWGSWTHWPLEAMRQRIRQGPPPGPPVRDQL